MAFLPFGWPIWNIYAGRFDELNICFLFQAAVVDLILVSLGAVIAYCDVLGLDELRLRFKVEITDNCAIQKTFCVPVPFRSKL